MRFVLFWCVLSLALTGCAQMQTRSGSFNATSATPSKSDPDFSPAFRGQQPKGTETAAISEDGDQSGDQTDQELTQPLEEEVTQPPQAEAANATQLSAQERQALQSEPEINFQLDIKETDILEDYFVYYSKKKHHTFQHWLSRAEKYLPYIRKVFTAKGLPQDLIFLPFAESGFNPLAYSHAGAAGLWQFMPGTGRMYGLKVNWWIDERRDPYKATRAAADYLKQLSKRFGDWYLVLAAYNAGGGHISRAMRRSGTSNFFDLASSRQIHKETCRYVPKFLAILKIVRNLDTLGFQSLAWDAPAAPTSVQVPPGTNLAALADSLGMSWSQFQNMNPAFRRTASPPGGSFAVHVPSSKLAAAKEFLSTPRTKTARRAGRYRIRPGDSWWQLSRRFDVPISALKEYNQTSSNILHPGDWVLIPGSGDHPRNSGGNGSGQTYVVRSGDTMWNIAHRLGTTASALLQANPGASPRALHPGQTLNLPGQTATRRIASRRANYVVKSGDTLWGISRRFDLSLSSLIQANGLSKHQTLKVGTHLYIPDMTYAQRQETKRTARQARVRYQVRKGDNVWSIARKFGVSAKRVLSWNNLSSRDIIHPGDTLTIYIQ